MNYISILFPLKKQFEPSVKHSYKVSIFLLNFFGFESCSFIKTYPQFTFAQCLITSMLYVITFSPNCVKPVFVYYSHKTIKLIYKIDKQFDLKMSTS